MANIFTSSIGKKLIMSISGLFLIIFLLLHLTINFFSVIDSCTGNFGSPDGLFALGCEFMSTPIVTIMVPVLAFGFIIHIIYACYLTYCNIQTRGGYNRYEVASKARTESWASKNMLVLGIIVLGLIALHLTHFWDEMQLKEFMGQEATDPYLLLTTTFGHWWMVVLYIVWFAALWFHLTHGFWSAFQTIGWSNKLWEKRLKVIGYIFATIIFLGFTTVAINGFIQAM
ncbi:MAG: succinate dehydrogenase cytochrome b subunit [Bacteroidetes bacterium]|uniref:Succinate dehydrogenase cytochrome b subunit n=1 Tax=Candidatus Cryptobacteroides faecigallinarum TaxID=2840763 RepID=A0A9D9ILE4_9BACT|nr:succinate dehydrogenase cytochrome b subunit [Candidatus Cryptobacteroides faecigallinarum]